MSKRNLIQLSLYKLFSLLQLTNTQYCLLKKIQLTNIWLCAKQITARELPIQRVILCT
jgi:hypothetical protein